MPGKSRVWRRYGRSKVANMLDEGTKNGVAAWVLAAAQLASTLAPVDTGRLARSIEDTKPVLVSYLTWKARIQTNVEYARAQEMGSGLHSEDPAYRKKYPIVAKNAKSLAFAWEAGPKNHSAYDPESGLFFFKSVMHPGVPPQPYLRPAARETKELGSEFILRAIAAEIAKANASGRYD